MSLLSISVEARHILLIAAVSRALLSYLKHVFKRDQPKQRLPSVSAHFSITSRAPASVRVSALQHHQPVKLVGCCPSSGALRHHCCRGLTKTPGYDSSFSECKMWFSRSVPCKVSQSPAGHLIPSTYRQSPWWCSVPDSTNCGGSSGGGGGVHVAVP